jgi:capsular polysaccharide transport system permease protein
MSGPDQALSVRGASLPGPHTPRTGIAGAARQLASKRPFLAYMLLVCVLAATYYGVISSRLYVSETRFAIRSTDVAAPTGILAGLMGQTTGLADITAVSDYIRSPDMLKVLEQRHHLRALYDDPKLDLLQWMPSDASDEHFLGFYRRHVIVKLDREASVIIVQVRSFTPESASGVANSIIELTGNFVDGMTQKMRNETLSSAKAELDRANRLADEARQRVASFRGASSDLDPSQSGAIVVGGIGSLESTATGLKSELAALMTYSQPDAPAVRQLRAKLAAVNAQIASQKAKQGSNSNLSNQVTAFETVQLNRTNAERTLTLAQTGYDQARATAEQREKYVVQIVKPNLPQDPTYPNRLLEFVTVIIFAMAGYALVSLTIAAINDHKGV